MASQRESEIFNAKWSELSTNMFVNILVEEVKKGNRTTCTFNKAGWNNIRAEFTKQSGFQYTLVQLKNKTNKLRRQYASFKKLISQSGFGWDHVNKTVVVDDPSIWESHIKDNKEWAKFKKEGFPQYPDLCIVFGDTYATGEYAIGNAEEFIVSDEDDNAFPNVGNLENLTEHLLDEDVFTSKNTAPEVHHKHNLDRTPNTKRRRKSSSVEFSNACKVFERMIKSKESQSSTTSQVTEAPEDPFSIVAVMDVLNAMPELEQTLYNKAAERACADAAWRVAFIKAAVERRVGFLQHLQ